MTPVTTKPLRHLIAIAAIIASTTPLSAQAQTTREQAMAHFFAAEESFDAGDYEGALQAVLEAERLSGQTGPRLLKLEAQTLSKLGRYEDAKVALNEFYASGPSEKSKREISSTLLEVDRGLAEVVRQRDAAAERERVEETRRRAAEAERRRQDDLKKRKAQDAEAALVRLLQCETGEACFELAEQFASSQDFRGDASSDFAKVYNFYRWKADETIKGEYEILTRVRFNLLRRSCTLNSIPGCREYASIFAPKDRSSTLSRLCDDENDARSCFIKGFGLAGLHLEPFNANVWSIYDGKPISFTGASAFEQEAKKARSRSRHVRGFVADKSDFFRLFDQGIPFIVKACELDYLEACFLLSENDFKIAGKRRNSKKVQRNARKRLCSLDPNATGRGGRPICR